MKNLRRLEELIPAVLMGLIVVLVCVNVVMRYVFRASIPFATELASVAFVWMIMLSAGVVLRKGLLLGIDILPRAVDRRLGRTYRAVVMLLSAVIMIVFAVIATDYAISTFGRVIPVLNAPYIVVTAAIPVGAVLLAVQATFCAVGELRPHNPRSRGSQ